MTQKLHNALIWLPTILGIAGWLTMPVLPFGFGIAGAIAGLILIKKTDKADKKTRKILWIGFAISLVRALAFPLMLAWVFIAFMLNPIPH